MPKYGIHHIVIQEAIGRLMTSTDTETQSIGNEMAAHPGYANFGAIGPDLFFWAPDYDIVDTMYPFYKNYKELVELYNEIVQPIRDVIDTIKDGAETVAPSTYAIIEALLHEVRETADLFSKTATEGLFAGIISGANLVTDAAGFPSLSATFFDSVFKPELQKGNPIADWYWFDMLHYRRTGQFARALSNRASTPQTRTYARGYLSHIATDVVGHAYVNQVVGGPYRMHMQRHVTVENYMDVWKYHEYYGENISSTLAARMALPKPDDISDAVISLLNDALRDVYASEHPTRLGGDGFLSEEQIWQTYEVFYDVLQLMSSRGVGRPEEPFSNVADILRDALDDLMEPPPVPPSSPSSSCSLGDIFSFGLTSSSRDCYKNFFENLDDWLSYIGDLIKWAFETLLDLVDLLLAALLSLPATVIMAVLYGIQLMVYEIYQIVRSTLALEGFIYPEPGDLNSSHGRNLTTPFQCNIRGCGVGTVADRPLTHVPDDVSHALWYPRLANLDVSHLVCPNPNVEQPVTIPNPINPDMNTNPNSFIRDLPLDIKALYSYASSPGAEATRALHANCRRIGNATDFTAWMITAGSHSGATEREKQVCFTDWNLDSDRGYAYKTWDWLIEGSDDTHIREGAYVG